MGLNVSEAWTQFINSDTVSNTFRNPIVIGLIIVALVALVMYFVLRDQVTLADDSTRGFIYFIVTVGIYTLVGTLGIVYLHNRVISRACEKKYKGDAERNTVERTIGRGSSEFRRAWDQKIYPQVRDTRPVNPHARKFAHKKARSPKHRTGRVEVPGDSETNPPTTSISEEQFVEPVEIGPALSDMPSSSEKVSVSDTAPLTTDDYDADDSYEEPVSAANEQSSAKPKKSVRFNLGNLKSKITGKSK